jgi:hypothetical protein
MLIEQLIKVPGLQMIQANTDGVTYLCPNEYLEHTRSLQAWWSNMTQLELEEVLYNRMFIRDVNSYIAEKADGSLKRIGAYAYETAEENPGTRELPWHKDWSFRIIAKAAEAVLVHGRDLESFIRGYGYLYDFFGRTKVPRNSQLHHGGERVPNIVRYLVTNGGAPLEKVMPSTGPIGQFKKSPNTSDLDYYNWHHENGNVWNEDIHTKNKSTHQVRRIGINTGWNVTIWNQFDHEEWNIADAMGADFDINYDFYIKEAEKLINLLPG